MEDDLYLDEDKKSYYMLDFKNLLAYNGSDFWDIDNDLSNLLININQNKNLQTLYSKRFEIKNDSFGVTRKSYLKVAYTKAIEEKLYNSLLKIQETFGDEAILEAQLPEKENSNTSGVKTFGIACIDDIEYFNIHVFKIELESYEIASHEEFWKLLENKLSNLA
jgi:hypothetical protein